MLNKHFISMSASTAELETLDEPALSAQVAFWTHMVDRLLFSGKTVGGDLPLQADMLDARLTVFSRKYGTGSSFYQWADKVLSLCRQALDAPDSFAYPKEGHAETGISEAAFDRLIQGRRSVRQYTGEPVDDVLICKVLEAARWAPSSCNMQGLRYIVVKSDEAKPKIKRNMIDIENAACVISVIADLRMYCDGDIECACHDSGAAVQNILLACHQLGLGACYISDTGLNSQKFRSLLPLQEHEKVTALVAIGRYKSAPMAPGRIDTEKVTKYL